MREWQTLEDAFAAARDLSKEERNGFVDGFGRQRPNPADQLRNRNDRRRIRPRKGQRALLIWGVASDFDQAESDARDSIARFSNLFMKNIPSHRAATCGAVSRDVIGKLALIPNRANLLQKNRAENLPKMSERLSH